jgi:hypothetical protein
VGLRFGRDASPSRVSTCRCEYEGPSLQSGLRWFGGPSRSKPKKKTGDFDGAGIEPNIAENPLISIFASSVPQPPPSPAKQTRLSGDKKGSNSCSSSSSTARKNKRNSMFKTMRKNSVNPEPSDPPPPDPTEDGEDGIELYDEAMFDPKSPAEQFAEATGYSSPLNPTKGHVNSNLNMATGGLPTGGRVSPANQMNMVHRRSFLRTAPSWSSSGGGKGGGGGGHAFLNRFSYLQSALGEQIVRKARRISGLVINSGSGGQRVHPGGDRRAMSDGTNSNVEMEEEEREPEWKTGSWQRVVWSLACFAAAMYYVCIIPYRTIVLARINDPVIDLHDSGFAGQVTADYLVDFFFVMDIVVRMKWMSTSPAEYMQSSFLLDVVAVLPVDVVMGLSGGTEGLEYYRLNRMLKMFLVFDYFRGVEEWLEYRELMVTPAVQRMLRFYLIFSYVCHFHACVMFAISFYDTQRGLATWPLLDLILFVENADECCSYPYPDTLGMEWASYTMPTTNASCVPCKVGLPTGLTPWNSYRR